MLETWQHLPEKLNPIAFSAGSVQVSWYGIMYLVAFAIVYYLVRYRIRTEKLGILFETVQAFFPWAIVGLLLGARIGDVLIYDWSYFQNHLSQIFLPFDIYNHWQYIGFYGMSYHGGLIGVALAFYIFCRVRKISLLEFSDLFAPVVPIAYTFGRLGNFINGELYGRVTAKFWGMYFPADFTGQLRHPSQLYEAFFEGIFLFFIIWIIRKGSWRTGSLTALYLIGYGTVRFFIEFFREPEIIFKLFSLTLTTGQWLCLFMVVAGILLLNKRLITKVSKRRA